MEAIGVVASFSSQYINSYTHAHMLYRGLQRDAHIQLLYRLLFTWLSLYIGSLILYFSIASLDFFYHFKLYPHYYLPKNFIQQTEIRREITTSIISLAAMTALTAPIQVAIQLGYSKVYHQVSQYGYFYLFISPILFLAFSDFCIYFIHRILHHPLLYKHLHKSHHSFIYTTPFAAFAFHPLDGYLQGLPYQLFVFIFPIHSTVHLFSFIVVTCWTINIHDQVTWSIPGVNGAAHHAIHHTSFRSNYGQYTTFWDKLCGSFKDPKICSKNAALTLTEKHVYGKDE